MDENCFSAIEQRHQQQVSKKPSPQESGEGSGPSLRTLRPCEKKVAVSWNTLAPLRLERLPRKREERARDKHALEPCGHEPLRNFAYFALTTALWRTRLPRRSSMSEDGSDHCGDFTPTSACPAIALATADPPPSSRLRPRLRRPMGGGRLRKLSILGAGVKQMRPYPASIVYPFTATAFGDRRFPFSSSL
jgi:hypothetical protein